MIKKLLQAAIVSVGGLALGGCPLEQAKTTAPVKPPAADYQAAVPASPPATNIRGICYNPADLTVYRARMLQMELNVATLQCQTTGGSRAYEDQYRAFIGKFQTELAANGRSMQQLGSRKRFNLDIVVTEFANRTAQRAPDRQGILLAQQAGLRLGPVDAGQDDRPGAAAVRPRPRDERLSLPRAVNG